MRTARQSFISICGQPSAERFLACSALVQVVGIGFFDNLHGQTGVAPNGIELHPVLSITVSALTVGRPRRTLISQHFLGLSLILPFRTAKDPPNIVKEETKQEANHGSQPPRQGRRLPFEKRRRK